jgi:hypothetical protein
MNATLLTLMVLAGQIRYERATIVGEGEKLYPLLAREQGLMEGEYRQSGHATPVFEKWVHVKSPAAAKLFPDLQFFSVRWSEKAIPSNKGRPSGLAFGLERTLGIDPQKKLVVVTMYNSGYYEPFGKLLVDRKVKIRDDGDALLVWQAFCDVHHHHWMDYALRKIDDESWRLGIFRYDQTVASDENSQTVVTNTHYMNVGVDPESHQIVSWKSVVETSDRREVPKPEGADRLYR